MGVSSNKAYEGQFSKNTVTITVYYANQIILDRWNRGRTRHHPDNWKAGWYWTVGTETKDPGMGPYTGSRNAYKAAVATVEQTVQGFKERAA